MFQSLTYGFRSVQINDSEFSEKTKFQESDIMDTIGIYLGTIRIYEEKGLDVVSNFILMFFWDCRAINVEPTLKTFQRNLAFFSPSANICAYAPAIIAKLQAYQTFQ